MQQQQRPAPAEQVEEGLPTGSAPAEPGEKPSQEEAIAMLRAAKTADALKEARKTIWGLYAAAQSNVPLPVEFAATTQREKQESAT